MEVRIRLKLLGRAAVLTWTGRLKSIRLLSHTADAASRADFDMTSSSEEVRAWGSHFDRRADEDTSLSRAAEGRPALRVTNAPAFSERSPAAIGTRSGSRKSTSAENTDSRPARRQVHLVHGL